MKGLFFDMWNLGLESKIKVLQAVKFVKDAGITDVFLQVRRRGDAFYDSTIEPEANFGSISYKFDLLKDVVEKKGPIKIHAYLTMLQLWRAGFENKGQYPDNWIIKDASGKSWLNPVVPEVRTHLAKVCGEIVSKYPVDGICLEKMRYPEKDMWLITDPASGEHAKDPSTLEEKEQALTQLIGQINRAVKSVRDIPIFIVVKANGNNFDFDRQYNSCDWQKWLRERYCDYVMPLLMNKPLNHIRVWAGLLEGVKAIPVLGCFSTLTELKAEADLFAGKDKAFYSYANFSSDKNDTRVKFLELLKNAQ